MYNIERAFFKNQSAESFANDTLMTMLFSWLKQLIKIGFFYRRRCNRSFTTQVESATQNPVWAAKHVFANISHQDFLDVQLQVSVWNFSNTVQHDCIGTYTFLDSTSSSAYWKSVTVQSEHMLEVHDGDFFWLWCFSTSFWPLNHVKAREECKFPLTVRDEKGSKVAYITCSLASQKRVYRRLPGRFQRFFHWNQESGRVRSGRPQIFAHISLKATYYKYENVYTHWNSTCQAGNFLINYYTSS